MLSSHFWDPKWDFPLCSHIEFFGTVPQRFLSNLFPVNLKHWSGEAPAGTHQPWGSTPRTSFLVATAGKQAAPRRRKCENSPFPAG